MKKILLDTNSYTKYANGDRQVAKNIKQAELVYMSTIVLGELYAGFKGGTFETKNKANLNLFLSQPTVSIIKVSAKTAEIYGEVKNQLKNKGKLIPQNDMWIASHTLETDSILISFDQHFLEVSGLKIADFSNRV